MLESFVLDRGTLSGALCRSDWSVVREEDGDVANFSTLSKGSIVQDDRRKSEAAVRGSNIAAVSLA